MALILTQDQKDSMSAAVALLKPADPKKCEEMVEAYLERWIPVHEAPPRGNPVEVVAFDPDVAMPFNGRVRSPGFFGPLSHPLVSHQLTPRFHRAVFGVP